GGAVHDVEPAILDHRYVLVPEALVDPAIEDLVALRVLDPLVELGERLGRLHQPAAVLGPAIVGILHRALDDVERLPAAEHMAGGRDVAGIVHAGAVLVDADGGAVLRDRLAVVL